MRKNGKLRKIAICKGQGTTQWGNQWQKQEFSVLTSLQDSESS